MKQIHLGCGKVRLPGFINIDIQPGPAVDLVGDIRNLDFEDSSIDLVYSCAVIEHVGRREWVDLLKDWRRVLKPGGGQKDDYDWHGMIFDFKTLERGLIEAGFENIRRYDWRETELGRLGIDDYSMAYLPHMDKENGRLMMLNVEANRK